MAKLEDYHGFKKSKHVNRVRGYFDFNHESKNQDQPPFFLSNSLAQNLNSVTRFERLKLAMRRNSNFLQIVERFRQALKSDIEDIFAPRGENLDFTFELASLCERGLIDEALMHLYKKTDYLRGYPSASDENKVYIEAAIYAERERIKKSKRSHQEFGLARTLSRAAGLLP